MKRFMILSGFLLGAALLAPLATADEHDRDHDRDSRRYYDRDGRDYHVYNNQEDRAYRVYLGEQHRDYREFNRLKRGEQQQYFKWRHEHPDDAPVKVEVR